MRHPLLAVILAIAAFTFFMWAHDNNQTILGLIALPLVAIAGFLVVVGRE